MGQATGETITVGEFGVRFLVEGAESNGSVSVFECYVPAGSRMPAPHSHDAFEETVYGLEGATTWRIDGETTEVGVGEALCVPRGAIHGFENRGGEDATFLAIASPGVFGAAYFREIGEVLAASAGGPPDLAELGEVMRRHGLTPVAPAEREVKTSAAPGRLRSVTLPSPLPASIRRWGRNGPVLSARDVVKHVGSGRARQLILRGVDLDVGRGEMVAVLGRSGSGKSTLLHLLGGLDRPDARPHLGRRAGARRRLGAGAEPGPPAQHRLRLPVLPADRGADRRRERDARRAAAGRRRRAAQRRARRADRAARGGGGRRPPPARALRRRAAALRDRPGAGQRPGAGAGRRGDREPRLQLGRGGPRDPRRARGGGPRGRPRHPRAAVRGGGRPRRCTWSRVASQATRRSAAVAGVRERRAARGLGERPRPARQGAAERGRDRARRGDAGGRRDRLLRPADRLRPRRRRSRPARRDRPLRRPAASATSARGSRRCPTWRRSRCAKRSPGCRCAAGARFRRQRRGRGRRRAGGAATRSSPATTSPRRGVVVEQGLADDWGLGVGDTIRVGRSAPLRVVGLARAPDNVAYPLADAARSTSRSPRCAAAGVRTGRRVNVAQIWLRDPAQLDAVLVQARMTSYGLTGLSLITRSGVRVADRPGGGDRDRAAGGALADRAADGGGDADRLGAGGDPAAAARGRRLARGRGLARARRPGRRAGGAARRRARGRGRRRRRRAARASGPATGCWRCSTRPGPAPGWRCRWPAASSLTATIPAARQRLAGLARRRRRAAASCCAAPSCAAADRRAAACGAGGLFGLGARLAAARRARLGGDARRRSRSAPPSCC